MHSRKNPPYLALSLHSKVTACIPRLRLRLYTSLNLRPARAILGLNDFLNCLIVSGKLAILRFNLTPPADLSYPSTDWKRVEYHLNLTHFPSLPIQNVSGYAKGTGGVTCKLSYDCSEYGRPPWRVGVLDSIQEISLDETLL